LHANVLNESEERAESWKSQLLLEKEQRASVESELATARLTIDCLKARLKLYEPVDSVLMGGMSAE
jgi:hypothetical protein